MLRHSVPIKTLPLSTFLRVLEALRVERRNSTLHFASLLERGNEKYEIFAQVGIEPTNVAFRVARLCRCAAMASN